jgi:hypothetical protein
MKRRTRKTVIQDLEDSRTNLRLERAKFRAVNSIAKDFAAMVTHPPMLLNTAVDPEKTWPSKIAFPEGEVRFVQCWCVTRGVYSTTQGLDVTGRVWEMVTLMEEVEVDGKKKRVPKEVYWIPVAMQVRKGAEPQA